LADAVPAHCSAESVRVTVNNHFY